MAFFPAQNNFSACLVTTEQGGAPIRRFDFIAYNPNAGPVEVANWNINLQGVGMTSFANKTLSNHSRPSH